MCHSKTLSVVPASLLQFPSSATAVAKSSGQVQIPVTRTGPANRTATAAYSVSGGSGGMLTFAPGDYQENVTVPTTGNVTITLSGESANTILGPQSSTSVVVVNDDAPTPQPGPGPGPAPAPGKDTTAPSLLAGMRRHTEARRPARALLVLRGVRRKRVRATPRQDGRHGDRQHQPCRDRQYSGSA